MGKASILLVVGFGIFFLMSGLNLSSVSVRAYDNAMDYYEGGTPRNIAIAGANMAANRLFYDPAAHQREPLVARVPDADQVPGGAIHRHGRFHFQYRSVLRRTAAHHAVDRDLSRQHVHGDGHHAPEQLRQVRLLRRASRPQMPTGKPGTLSSGPPTRRESCE